MLNKLFHSTTSEEDNTVPEESVREVHSGSEIEWVVEPTSNDDPDISSDVTSEELEEAAVSDHEVETDQVVTQKEDITSVRELIMSLHPAIVPELITGDSVAALIASIGPAQEAYNRIVADLPDVRIPAGGNPVVSTDPSALSTFDKIRRGLSETRPGARGTFPAAK